MYQEDIRLKVEIAFFGNFIELREVQVEAFEPIFSGQNAIICSGTGSGKTEAAVAPLVARYYEVSIDNDDPFLLYVTPTKALANDLKKRLERPLELLSLSAGIRHGDKNDLKLKKKPNIIITTSESLDVLLFKDDPALNQIKAVILDEIHFLYNTQRGLQLAILLNRLRKKLRHDFQWVALSATISNADDYIQFFFPDVEKSRIKVINRPSNRGIEALVCPVSSPDKLFNKVLRYQPSKVLGFVNNRRLCEEITESMRKFTELSEYIFCHHSSLSPKIRVKTEQEFSKMETSLCIATSTLELGIDIGDIDLIVLWDVPPGIEAFLQRLGRGNRRENKNKLICAIPEETKNILLTCLKFLSLYNLAIRGLLPNKRPYQLYGAVVQQILSLIASRNGSYRQKRDLYEMIDFLGYINEQAAYELLEELVENQYLRRHDFYLSYGGADKLYELVDSFDIYSNIGRCGNEVKIKNGKLEIGRIPSENLKKIQEGDQFIFGGKMWEAIQKKGYTINVKPAEHVKKPVNITYSDEYPLNEAYVVDYLWRIIHEGGGNSIFNIGDLEIHRSIESLVKEKVKTFSQICQIDRVPVIKDNGRYIYFTFAGELINSLLSYSFNGGKIEADEISFITNNKFDWEKIEGLIDQNEGFIFNLLKARTQKNIYQELLPERLRKKELLEYWRKDESLLSIRKRLSESNLVFIEREDDRKALLELSTLQ